MSVIIRREMSITREDFFRILPKALKDFRFEINGDNIKCQMESGNIQIFLNNGDKRKIGALELPVIHIKFVLENVSDEKRTEFFTKFDFAYQKGGG